jgi:GDA1/CD39 (nucleoside phosphatase) family
MVADGFLNGKSGNSGSVVNSCFHSGYSEKNTGSGTYTGGKPGEVTIQGPSSASNDQFDKCAASIRPLMNKDLGTFCNQVYNGDCSIGGAYQPQLPDDGKFIGTSSYLYPWEILMLSGSANLEDYKAKAQYVCSLSFSGVQSYHDANRLVDTDSKLAELMPYFCFLTTYVYVLLIGKSASSFFFAVNCDYCD